MILNLQAMPMPSPWFATAVVVPPPSGDALQGEGGQALTGEGNEQILGE